MFARTAEGMELVEVAPGIDIERDILAHMDFRPIVREPRPMDARIFRDEPMQLDDTLLGLRLEDRISYDAERNLLFLNLEGMTLRTRDDVDRWRRVLEERCSAIGRKVVAVVNYDGFTVDPAVADTYAAMVRYIDTHYYAAVSRYTTSAFMRAKLGEALARRSVAPHIFESAAEAHASRSRAGAPAQRRTSAEATDARRPVQAFGPPDTLVVEDVPSPRARPDQVVVTVKAAAINFPDSLIIEGKYQIRPEPPFSPGFEVAGVIKECGAGVTGFAVGDRVIAITTWGGYAEEVAVGAENLIPMPAAMDFPAASAFMTTYGTSYYALKDRAQLRAGESLLVLGASGGVGIAAIQIGKALGARVIAAASSEAKLEVCRTRAPTN